MKIKNKNKKGIAPIVIILLVVGALAVVISSGMIDIGGLTGTEQVWKAEQGYMSCEKDDSPQTIIKYVDQNYIFTCGADYLVDDCEIILFCEKKGVSGCIGSYRVNDGKKIDYSIQRGETQTITTIQAGQKISFSQSGLFVLNKDNTKISYKYYPYRLYSVEGAKFLTSSSDCCLANQNELQKKNFNFGDWKCLEKSGNNKILNYFIDWRLTEGRIYTYKGKEVICASQSLYELKREKLADSTIRNRQGEKIKDVECCPYQSNKCDLKTFTFKRETQGKECSYNYECENSGNPWTSSSKSAKIEKCESGMCVEISFVIECNSDAVCRQNYGENYGCDLTNDNFGTCIKIGQISPVFCGDGKCTTGETKENCPNDCEIECSEGYSIITKEKKINCKIGFPLYFGCDKEVTKECKKDTPNYLLWILIIVGAIVVYLFILRPFLKGTKIGRLLP